MDSRELVAWNMRRLRVGQTLSQERLAELAEVDRTYVSRLERMMENPSIGILDKIATALGVSIAELFAPPSAEEPKPKPLKAGRRPKVVE
ncbi:XRE family transcriptional regulator [Devosia soli]|uniref:XRE family transcriptional regulator n=1 Tax=Devosia soli TaxID=361041 RepID=A0A0F5L753_9HYPH|nr:helix-turn-helix transcriptional regulator [Devosia soli]KKB78173.1 XRE family transcriptional regulator [Devosia soli]